MKVTLVFPSYLHLSGFLSVTDNAHIEMDLRTRSLTAGFSERDIAFAIRSFCAEVAQALNP